MDDEDLILMNEACKISGVSRRTIYRFMEAGKFPAPVSGFKTGLKVRFNRKDINDWSLLNNPAMANEKLVAAKDISVATGIGVPYMYTLSRINGFPDAKIIKGKEKYYKFLAVVEWFSLYRPRVKFNLS